MSIIQPEWGGPFLHLPYGSLELHGNGSIVDGAVCTLGKHIHAGVKVQTSDMQGVGPLFKGPGQVHSEEQMLWNDV